MLFPPPPVNVGSAAVTERPVAAEMCRVNQKFDGQTAIKAELGQRHFAFGGYLLALDQNPKLLVDARNGSFEVEGWNIRLPNYRAGEISREIIRKFLFLHGKAERRELSSAEGVEWAEIVRRVDYRKFSIETAPPVYVEGKLVGKSAVGCDIEWHDGAREVVHSAVGDASLALLNPGEWFKAYGKFGEENRLVALSQLTPIPAPEAAKGDELWESWASNRS